MGDKVWCLFTAVVYEGYDFRGVFDSQVAAVDAGNKIIENMGDDDRFDWCYVVEADKNKSYRKLNSLDALFLYDSSEEK